MVLTVIRRAAEYGSRRVVLPRRLPRAYGRERIWVSPGAVLGFWRLRIERVDPDLLAWVDQFVSPGDVVWDIGSNVGLFGVAAAHRAGVTGHVVAVEPDPWLVNLLRRSAAAGSPRRAPMTVVPAGVSDQLGLAELNIAARGRASSCLASAQPASQAGGVRETCHVITVALDWLLPLNIPPASRHKQTSQQDAGEAWFV